MIRRRLQSGVSLVEALVALVVMAIGAVAVVSLQLSVRGSSDVAKQRAEAVRLAQEVVEDWRGFSSFNALAAKRDWTDLVSTAAGTPTPLAGSNVTFLREITVIERGAANDDPLSKTIHVKVTWGDRTGSAQEVHLNTLIGGVLPELGGSLSITGSSSLIGKPGSRHSTIPRSAIDLGDGTSEFAPPGGGPVRWVFNNTTGLIQSCSGAGHCASGFIYRLLAGFVMFATDLTEPTPAVAEAPASPALNNIGVRVRVDIPTSLVAAWFPDTPYIACFSQQFSTYLEYYCAVPSEGSASAPGTWTGEAEANLSIGGYVLASPVTSKSRDQYRVCRYTPAGWHSLKGAGTSTCDPDKPLVGDLIYGATGTTASCTTPPPAPSKAMRNADHPKLYAGVAENLINQNFLVIRAGNDNPGSSADDSTSILFDCPGDDTSTTQLNGNTRHHQPPGP